ncbi:NAD-dependent epimerase/dehydratase family protein [Algoriella sp.]|uniref:NAD-dependent epimerase/dehydratase family protein n=1 Tax=Algoriella sp. TaxID=1872434 RepID=UPI001B2E4349|nr:NAD-dependent epimerase/dehydratase family protein [Algoriella sp.]MBO6211291.1 NAD-dependent epimerase/dehydratase family protein [Algoriella sp.]
MKVIITGTTGMVGEGVLFECLQNSKVSEILSISRKEITVNHPKLKQLIVQDFTKLDDYKTKISGYDACFFCAGISSVGMKEDQFAQITYDTTIAFAKTVLANNPNLTFCYVSGRGTDSTEQGKTMWARVKGKTENELMKMPFKNEFNFRPAAMLPFPNQQYVNKFYTFIANVFKIFTPSSVLTLSEVGKAMINTVDKNGVKANLEIKEIKALSV